MVRLILTNKCVEIKDASMRVIRGLQSVTSYKVAGAHWSKTFRKGYWDGREHLLKYSDKAGYTVPPGLLADVTKKLKSMRVKYKVIQRKTIPGEVDDFTWNESFALRPYQHETVEKVMAGNVYRGTGIIKLPPRGGKTIVAAKIIHDLRQRTIILVTSQMLLHQTQKMMDSALRIKSGIIGDSMWTEGPVTVATVQSLAQASARKDPRYGKLLRRYGLMFFDECFPAGTMIGDERIENVDVGDFVESFDENTQTFSKQKVIRVFKKRCSELVEVKLNDGLKFACTPAHPFFTNEGWIEAHDLKNKFICRRIENEEFTVCDGKMHDLRKRSSSQQRSKNEMEKRRACLLFKRMRKRIREALFIGSSEKDKRKVFERKFGKNEERKSLLETKRKRQNFCFIAKNKTQAVRVRWKRQAFANSARNLGKRIIKRIWLGNRIRSFNSLQENERRNADALQSRYCAPKKENSNRSRWGITRFNCGSTIRRKKRKVFDWIRVEGVKIQKQGGDGKFESLCPSGFVYNLEVENTNTYTMNGIVVHNCHHLPAKTWHAVVMDFNLPYRIGLSATAYLEDNRETERGVIWLKALCGDIRMDITPSELIEAGWLTRPTVEIYPIIQPDNLKNKRWSTILASKAIYENPHRNKKIIEITKSKLGEHPNVLILTNRLAQVRDLSVLLHGVGIDHITITGSVRGRRRREMMADFAFGHVRVLLGTVFGEGVDIPEVVCVINAEGGSDIKSTMQRMRNLTPHEGKTQAVFVDFADLTNPYFADHSRHRINVYRSEGAFNVKVIKG